MNPDSFVRTDGAYVSFHEEFDLSVVTTQVAGIGPIGPPRRIDLSDDICSVVGQHVWKVGSASGLTQGTIAAYAVEHREGETSLFTDLLIVGRDGHAFDCEGDSGALVLMLPTAAAQSPIMLATAALSSPPPAAPPPPPSSPPPPPSSPLAAPIPSTALPIPSAPAAAPEESATTAAAAVAAAVAATAGPREPAPAAAEAAPSTAASAGIPAAAARSPLPLPQPSAAAAAALLVPVAMVLGGAASRGGMKLGSGRGAQQCSSAVDLFRLLSLLELEMVTSDGELT
ncbi:unnamed protein product, partial [Closterium sp. Naga37s-1]